MLRNVMSYAMPATAAAALLLGLQERDVDVCVGGGWSIDALLGEQTREHSDLDLWLEASMMEGLFGVLVECEPDRIFPWPGDRPWNFVLHDGRSRRVDLHLFETREDGCLPVLTTRGTVHGARWHAQPADCLRCPAGGLPKMR